MTIAVDIITDMRGICYCVMAWNLFRVVYLNFYLIFLYLCPHIHNIHKRNEKFYRKSLSARR